MIEDYKDLLNEINMLNGNINRMCVTENVEEIVKMSKVATERLQEIYVYNMFRLNHKALKELWEDA